jgi:predicted RNase H-like HicB family nuclease
MTQGNTEEEAIRNIKEAIHLVLEATNEKGTNMPAVTAIELVA